MQTFDDEQYELLAAIIIECIAKGKTVEVCLDLQRNP